MVEELEQLCSTVLAYIENREHNPGIGLYLLPSTRVNAKFLTFAREKYCCFRFDKYEIKIFSRDKNKNSTKFSRN